MRNILGVILAIAMLAAPAYANILNNTEISHTTYREMVPGEAGITYEIRITNTGSTQRTYEIIPDAVIREIGTYRLDPWHTLTIDAGEVQTAYLHIALDSSNLMRKELPVNIVSGNSSAQIMLVARPIGPFLPQSNDELRSLLVAMLLLIIIMSVIYLFRRRKKKDGESKVETYY